MKNNIVKTPRNKPDFLIIGAQKCGTTWLWQVLKQHPGTDLRNDKEIQFFSSSKTYRKGKDWYYRHFQDTDPTKVNGEASTNYFYDRVLIDNITIDDTLPTIPELVYGELPAAKIILILRNPVQRAISAYYHHLQRRRFSLKLTFFEAAEKNPQLKMIERGYYSKPLKAWLDVYPGKNFLCLIFEMDVISSPLMTVNKLYSFLDLDLDYIPKFIDIPINKRWGWDHIWLNYYLGPWYGLGYRTLRKIIPVVGINWVDKLNIFPKAGINKKDLVQLTKLYSSQKEEIENMLGRSISGWD